jgi:hypothetical protein
MFVDTNVCNSMMTSDSGTMIMKVRVSKCNFYLLCIYHYINDRSVSVLYNTAKVSTHLYYKFLSSEKKLEQTIQHKDIILSGLWYNVVCYKFTILKEPTASIFRV